MLLNPKYSDNLRFAAFTIKINNMALPHNNNLCPKDAVDSVEPKEAVFAQCVRKLTFIINLQYTSSTRTMFWKTSVKIIVLLYFFCHKLS